MTPWNQLLIWPERMRRSGVLGMNRRNLTYIAEANQRRLYPRVDNKLVTKRYCHQHGIPVPETYGVLRHHSDLGRLGALIGSRSQFVVKPASGAAGRGVVVVARRTGLTFHTPSERSITLSEMRYHISTTISGLYSLGGRPDVALLEERLVSHPDLDRIAVGGAPDFRVILYRNVPVMAMVRLPTNASQGRANLHQGAVAAAIHLVTGTTFGGVCHNRAITHHPDTGELIAGWTVPDWERLLASAIRLGEALELGYLGVDFVIDAIKGAVVLEANARPGLGIQVAHGSGLGRRLDMIDQQPPEMLTGENRLALVSQLAEL